MIRIARRHLAVAAATLLFAGPAWALDSATIMAPAAPGGGWDSTARTMQEVLQSAGIVKTVQVENVAGAGGTIGIAQFIKKKGDGKAMMVGGLVMVGAILSNKSPVTLDDVTPLARLTSEWEALVVPANSPIKSVGDVVTRLKANPGSVSWGGGSAGGTDHILVGLIAQAVGADPIKINYIAHSGGGQALAAIMGGHVTVGVSGIGEFEAQVKAGQLRMIAVSSETKVPGVDAPTLKESGVNVVLGNWRAVFGPPGLSAKDKAEQLATIDRMVKSDAWKKQLEARGWADSYQAGDAFAAALKKENVEVAETLKSIGLLR
jgi:putative tricarboxylic transport membrane protein